MRRLIAVGEETIRQAEKLIVGCEFCTANAEVPFDWILDLVKGLRGSTTDYILEHIYDCRRFCPTGSKA